MKQRTIAGRPVSSLGLGEMPLSLGGRPDERQAIATIHTALEAGITLVDTADAYAAGTSDFGHGEALVARALRAWGGNRDEVLVATKGGHTRPDGDWDLDGSPAYLRTACEASLRRLGVETIDLYQLHRTDPCVPYADSIGALRELRDAGKVRLVGISNASVAQIDEARAILGAGGLASVQNELSPAFRSSEPELAHCAALDIAFLPWSPLGGLARATALADDHPAFGTVAAEHGVSPQQVCLAWLLAKASVVIPIPGASRPATIRDSVRAADLELSAAELASLDGDASRPDAVR